MLHVINSYVLREIAPGATTAYVLETVRGAVRRL